MNTKSNTLGTATLLCGLLTLVLGSVRLRTASELRDHADALLTQQRATQDAFHAEANRVSERYQAGEMDEAGWRRETELVSLRFKTDGETAGAAWLDQLASANRVHQQGLGLLLVAAACLVAGSIAAITCKGAEQ